MAENQVVADRGAAKVQVAVLEPQVLGHVVRAGGRSARDHRLVGDGERQRVGFGQHGQLGDEDFNATRFDVGVFRARKPLADFAPDRDAVFGVQRGRPLADLGWGDFRAENDLHDAAAVAEMNEHQAAVIAKGIDPAGEQHAAANVIRTELPAKQTCGKKHAEYPFCSGR